MARSSRAKGARDWSLAPQTLLMRVALAAAMRSGWLARRCGVDHARLTALLGAYTILDERRGKAGTDDKQASNPFRGGLVLTCVFNVLVGLMAGMLLSLDDPVTGMGFNQAVVLLFAVMVLATDYSAVLFDDTDTALVSPLPVPDRTFFAARVAHITIYLSLLLGSLALPGLLLGCFFQPPLLFAPTYVLSTLLTTVLAMALGFGFFVLAMRVFDMDRFKDVLLYVQVTMIVVMFGGMQLLPRLIDVERIGNVLTDHEWLAFALPSFHQGGLLAVVLGDLTARNLWLGGLALLLPAMAGLLLLRLASGGFLRRLARTSTAGVTTRVVRSRRSWIRDLLLRDPVRRAGFDFFRALSRRERSYRLRTYPMVAFALVMGISFTLSRHGEPHPILLCSAIYLLGIYLPAFLLQARFSENWEARWLLAIAPIARPGHFISGAMLGLAVGTFLPIFLLMFAAVWWIGGMDLLPDAGFAALAMLALGSQSIYHMGRLPPFTEKISKTAAEGTLAVTLGMGFLVMAFVGVHALLRLWMPLFVAAILVLVVVVWLTWRRIGRLNLRDDRWRFRT